VHDWVRATVGPVQVLREHEGGMSPGCAVSLLASEGRRVFVKAVAMSSNEDTVALFRGEIAVLERLPPARYRPNLRAVFDDGECVALMLDHIDGRYPDLSVAADVRTIAGALSAQSRELTPAPQAVDVPTLAERTTRWARRWTAMAEAPVRYLPAWAAADFDALYARVDALPRRLDATTLCHLDVREDNLLIRPDGSAVILDWGRPHRGPGWADVALLAGQVPPGEAERALVDWAPEAALDTATDLLLSFAGQAAWWAQQPPPPALPNLPAFCRQDAEHVFRSLERLIYPSH
jgi:hypothetical protein